jgi:mRNA-degrading endonuclease RelE of RelBE toxin-antitoxin system
VKKLIFTDQARADLHSLDRTTRLRILAAIQRLVSSGVGNVRKLQGIDPPEYRLRVGDFRVRFSQPDGETVRINRVQNRREVYR